MRPGPFQRWHLTGNNEQESCVSRHDDRIWNARAKRRTYRRGKGNVSGRMVKSRAEREAEKRAGEPSDKLTNVLNE